MIFIIITFDKYYRSSINNKLKIFVKVYQIITFFLCQTKVFGFPKIQVRGNLVEDIKEFGFDL